MHNSVYRLLFSFISLFLILYYCIFKGFPGGSEVKASPSNAGDLGSIPGLGRFPGGSHGNPLQYSYLENPMDWGAWWATVHRAVKSQTRLWMHAHMLYKRAWSLLLDKHRIWFCFLVLPLINCFNFSSFSFSFCTQSTKGQVNWRHKRFREAI